MADSLLSSVPTPSLPAALLPADPPHNPNVSLPPTQELLISAQNLLNEHAALLNRVRERQAANRRALSASSASKLQNGEPKRGRRRHKPNGSQDGDNSENELRYEQNRAAIEELLAMPVISLPASPTSDEHDRDSPPLSPIVPPNVVSDPNRDLSTLAPAKRARLARYANYVPEEETIRNDYSQRYVDSGEWPQNWVLGAEPERRFEEYPKQHKLLHLKKKAVNDSSLPPSYLPFSDLTKLLSPPLHPTASPTAHPQLPLKFDVLLLDPPLSFSKLSSKSTTIKPTVSPTASPKSSTILSNPFSSLANVSSNSMDYDTLLSLPIPSLAADPSFLFLWVGSGAGEALGGSSGLGLERGREIMAKWGYRRCEDVCWIRTNHDTNLGPGTDAPTTSLFTRTKQHCLIGIRGTVRRSTDSWFVHCNVDTDVIIAPSDPSDPTIKPAELYALIENFCLGTRRLELFGRAPTSLRRGWVTVLSDMEMAKLKRENAPSKSKAKEGQEWDGHFPLVGPDGDVATAAPFVRESWERGIRALAAQGSQTAVPNPGGTGKMVVPMTLEIDLLRPKSPVRPGQQQQQHQGGTQGHGGFATSKGLNPNAAQFVPGGMASMPMSANPMVMAQPMPMMAAALGGMNMGGLGMMGMDNWPMMNQMGVGGNMAHLGMGVPMMMGMNPMMNMGMYPGMDGSWGPDMGMDMSGNGGQ